MIYRLKFIEIKKRLSEDNAIYVMIRALMCLCLITIVSGYVEVFSSSAEFSTELWMLLIGFPASFFSLIIYITWVLTQVSVSTFPLDRNHPEMLVLTLIACALANNLAYSAITQTNDINQYVVAIMVILPTIGCGLFRNETTTVIILINSLLSIFYLHEFLPITYLAIIVNGQLLIRWLFKAMLNEYREKLISNQNLAELAATQRMLKSRVEHDTRQHIAQDLHDELGHLSTVLSNNIQQYLQTENTKHPLIEEIYPVVLSLNAQIRTITESMLEAQFDLISSLDALASCTHRPEIKITVDRFDRKFSAAVAETIFRACQETITNSIKHSNSTLLTINLYAENGVLMVTIQDNGSGKSGIVYGNGLRGIRTRIIKIGGSMEARLTTGGFHAELSIPYP